MSKNPSKMIGQSRRRINSAQHLGFFSTRRAYINIKEKVRLKPRKKMVRQ